jgi:hypothetical protein
MNLNSSQTAGRTGRGYLALVESDGSTIAHEYSGYPLLYEDVSYGLPLNILENLTNTISITEEGWVQDETPSAQQFHDDDYISVRSNALGSHAERYGLMEFDLISLPDRLMRYAIRRQRTGGRHACRRRS